MLLLLLAFPAAARSPASFPSDVNGYSLHPPYFNLAEGTRISATATCGEEAVGTGSRRAVEDLYCKLVGGPVAGGDPNQTIQVRPGETGRGGGYTRTWAARRASPGWQSRLPAGGGLQKGPTPALCSPRPSLPRPIPVFFRRWCAKRQNLGRAEAAAKSGAAQSWVSKRCRALRPPLPRVFSHAPVPSAGPRTELVCTSWQMG